MSTVLARIAKWVFLVVLAAVTVLPLLWLIISAFKTNTELFRDPFSWPAHWSFANFTGALDAQPLLDLLRNSVVVAVVATVATVVVATLAAYALLHRFRFSGALTGFLIFGILLPANAFITPIFYVIHHLGLYNSVWGIALTYVGLNLPIGFLIIKTYMDTIPPDILEAARIDGCGFHATLLRIVVPLVGPGIATASIFLAIAAWNELLYANLLSDDQHAQTIQVGVRSFLASYAANYPQAFAATAMAVIPTVIVYVVLSNRVIEGMTAGSIK
jgi:ABC-type glycerol-3-phosphate transport system permease component